MKARRQQAGQWLEGRIHQVELLCKEAAEYAGEDEYASPTPKAVETATALMKEWRKADSPHIGVTQDGEIVLKWLRASDKFKAVVRLDGSLAL
jgi:hypothetical protein